LALTCFISYSNSRNNVPVEMGQWAYKWVSAALYTIYDLGGEPSFTALPLNPKRYRNEHC